MAAGYQELFLEQGSDFTTTITLNDVDGNLYDLTDYTAKSQVKKSYYSSNTTAHFVVTINNPTKGIIIISLDSANTANISAGQIGRAHV